MSFNEKKEKKIIRQYVAVTVDFQIAKQKH